MYLGIDIGSTYIKAALSDGDKFYVGKRETGWDPRKHAQLLVESLLQERNSDVSRTLHTVESIAGRNLNDGVSTGGSSEILYSVSTGYGRNLYPSHEQITEITCHAKGSARLFEGIDFLIDIGGQDCKVIKVNGEGKVLDFVMNDKCAAGTGKFLQIMSERMGMGMEEFSRKANFERPARISNMCTVFAETEVISLIAAGESGENIIGGIFNSIAKRISQLALKFKGKKGALVGGGSNFVALKTALEKELGIGLETNRYSEYSGAIGAMLLAKNNGGKNENGNQCSKTI